MAASYLDKALSDLLFVSLVENHKKIERELFMGSAPLASFSSRITLAFYLGLISKSCRRDLDSIREIRNKFGHDPEVISFRRQDIADRCRNLAFSYHDSQAEPRSHFTASVMRVLAHIHREILSTKPHLEKPDDTPTQEEKESHRRFLAKLSTDPKPPGSKSAIEKD